MATEQEAIKFYIPAEEAKQFKAIALEKDHTISAILRRFVRNYIADNLAPEAPGE